MRRFGPVQVGLVVLVVCFQWLVPGSPALSAASSQDEWAKRCVEKCRSDYKKTVDDAAKLRNTGGYWRSDLSHNCPFPWDNGPGPFVCIANYDKCRTGCAGKKDADYKACRDACDQALQPCCYGNAIHNAEYMLQQRCLPNCGPVASDRKAAADLLLAQPSDMDALKKVFRNNPDSLSQNDFDNGRRMLAFDQVRAQMRGMNSAYSVVFGGSNRVWIVRSDGTQAQLPANLASLLRGGNLSGSENQTLFAGLQGMGFDREQATGIINSVRLGGDILPGRVLYFPTGGGWSSEVKAKYNASSEVGSIRGTINGGGDYI